MKGDSNQSRVSRRKFLKSGVAGLMAGTLATSGLAGTALAADFKRNVPGRIGGRRILLKGGTIISLDPNIGDFVRGDVLIDGNKIAAIDATLSGRGATVIDARGTIVVPGFVDTHRHCWQNYFRRAIPRASLLSDYAAFTHLGFAPFCRPEDHYAGNLISGLGAINSGVTSVLDYSHNSRTAAHVDAAIRAHFDTGLRAVFAYGAASFGTWDRQWPEDVRRVKRQFFASDDQLVSLRLATGLIPENYRLAREVGVKITSDAVIGEPFRPLALPALEELGRLGLLGPDVTFIHCTGLPDSVFQLMKETGTRCALAPTSDAHFRQLGDSIAPIQQAIDFDLATGLSVDVETSLSSDFFSQMRHAFYIQRMLANKRFHEGDANAPAPMTVRRVLEMATVGGALCNGLENKVGTLTPGKEADILMIEADDIVNLPLNNALGTVVLGADTSSVRNVFIAGKLMKWNGKLVGVDLAKVRRLVYASRDHVAAASGLWSPDDIIGDGPCASCGTSSAGLPLDCVIGLA